MKRFIVSIICILGCVWSSAQVHKRFSFLGVPLGTSITSFTEKSKTKGIIIHPDNRFIQNGHRLFQGKYYGQDATILASYDTNKKIVHTVKASILSSNRDKLNSLIYEFAELIKDEYNVVDVDEYVKDGVQTTIVEIEGDPNTSRVELAIHPYTDMDYELAITYKDHFEVQSEEELENGEHADFELLGVRIHDDYELTIEDLAERGYYLMESKLGLEPEILLGQTIGGIKFESAHISENRNKKVEMFCITSTAFFLKTSAAKAYETLVSAYKDEYDLYDHLKTEQKIVTKSDIDLPTDGSSQVVKTTTFRDQDGHALRISLNYQSANTVMAEYDEKYRENHWYVEVTIFPYSKQSDRIVGKLK